MHDPTDALSLVMQLCAAGMYLGDVTLLGAELGVGPPTSTTPPMSATGPPIPARPSTTSNTAPSREMAQHPHRHADPTQRPEYPKTATKRNASLASPLLSSTEPRDLTDLEVDVAHADHPGEGAAIHLSEEGNETPLRIQVCRPVGIKVPTTPPTPTIYEALRLRVATIRHIPAALQEHWSRTQAGILNAFCDNPSELLLWGLVAMPKLVLRVTRTRGKNAGAHQQDLIRSRLQQFEQGEWQDMWTTLKSESASPEGPETRSAKRARVDVHATNLAAVRQAQKYLAEGSPGKALQQITSPGLHDTRDPEVWEKLKQLHPRGPPLSLVTVARGHQTGLWRPRPALFLGAARQRRYSVLPTKLSSRAVRSAAFTPARRFTKPRARGPTGLGHSPLLPHVGTRSYSGRNGSCPLRCEPDTVTKEGWRSETHRCGRSLAQTGLQNSPQHWRREGGNRRPGTRTSRRGGLARG
jgi:hypothetical protein